MREYLDKFDLETNEIAPENQVFAFRAYRFSVITPYLLRVEKQDNGIFCDHPTQSVINRSFCEAKSDFDVKGNVVTISTDKTVFAYDTEKDVMISVKLYDGRIVSDYTKGNLKGTKRTLDNVNGKTKLGDGIISLSGVAVLDDSESLILKSNGRILPREAKGKDVYFFAYGYSYREAVKDLYNLTGNTPLIPRFTLGNWWSRYKAYTQDEYTSLMQRFIDERIPVTVATIDMDWHWVDVVKKFGKEATDSGHRNNLFEVFYNLVLPGWTGYSWNTDLFPDHKAFLSWLKSNGFKITMNLHPASGCKFYEDAYADFCEYMGIDKASHEQIRFDITDEKFIEGYFRFLHHPHENEGVDFWWIDWQQGKKTAVEGLDPLWALNHYHSGDIARDGKRPLILSRVAGAGSHRYPLGFSGDTVQTWESLDFQPYFTATASNIGYSWWSHDIGGHCRGYRDDELYLRWLQYGVFSPINRLHSTSNEFMGKEPWMYNKFVEENAVKFLKFRHRLIPYIYSMNRLTEKEGRCLIEPMYYDSPKDSRAYECPNEYLFGTEMIVCPITEKCDKTTGLAGTKAFLPKGRYTDIFTGRVYNGNCETYLFRDQSSIPVLAREGAIIPLDCQCDTNSTANPEMLEILIARGNNSFTLYEDDGETLEYKNGAFCETKYTVSDSSNSLVFTVSPATGMLSLIPEKRSYILSFIDIASCDDIVITVNGAEKEFKTIKDRTNLKLEISGVSCEDELIIKLNSYTRKVNPPKQQLLTELISKMKGSNDKKSAKFTAFIKKGIPTIIPSELKKPVKELDELVY